MKKIDYMFIMDYVDSYFTKDKQTNFNSDEVANSFGEYLKTIDEEEFINKIIFSGYIPDIYESDSSQETMFTKLVEVMTSEWARRMGFESEYVKQKASYQDVNIRIDGKIVVCDAKSFRLGRSQAAPNVKDFLKIGDITKWLDRYNKNERLGGLVVYPCKHEWSKGSDAYQYCSKKENPTVMLPYKYLAFLLYKKSHYDQKKLSNLWNYKNIFPKSLTNKTTNRKEYWSRIDEQIIKITNSSKKELKDFLNNADNIIHECIIYNKNFLSNIIELVKTEKKELLNSMDKKMLEQILLDFMIEQDTKPILNSIKNIERFRLNEKSE